MFLERGREGEREGEKHHCVVASPTPLPEAECSQEEGPKKGFVMGSRTQGVQEILEKCM